jgi:hypothetical protein
MVTTKTTFTTTQYVSISYDDVSTLDNQSWLLVHCFILENWVRIHILISLDRVLKGSSSNNLTKMIMEALTIREVCLDIKLLAS